MMVALVVGVWLAVVALWSINLKIANANQMLASIALSVGLLRAKDGERVPLMEREGTDPLRDIRELLAERSSSRADPKVIELLEDISGELVALRKGWPVLQKPAGQ